MLSDKTLERVSRAFRQGYRDGYAANEPSQEAKPDYFQPFADYDYTQGYGAGANDAKWEIPN